MVAGQPAFGQPALAIGQPLEASNGTGDHLVNESDIKALMPKLRRSDYYTKPTIEELAAKERAEPGYCGRVKDFVLGCHGAGHIKFLGEIDVRSVDLDSVIQFNRGAVILTQTRKEVGLNGTAEITYLCPKIDLHKKMRCHDVRPRSKKNAESFKKYLDDRGMEFVSYDSIKREYKFRVKYLNGSGYILFKTKICLAWKIKRKIKKLMTKIKKMISKSNT
ncbi:hypothetical protein OSB04_030232 [Centaurea solstitialis]|uniref:Peptidase S59 domain-containing protein n=1 Tax=Centaurea solstitialis TaxID=347529 RepID=A0AA38W4S1_9ASTR|nr:hypothetical protein OSB04_030232 [Centaurea solstitialis]